MSSGPLSSSALVMYTMLLLTDSEILSRNDAVNAICEKYAYTLSYCEKCNGKAKEVFGLKSKQRREYEYEYK
jgi:hypothetical protein